MKGGRLRANRAIRALVLVFALRPRFIFRVIGEMSELLTAYTWWRFFDLPASSSGWVWLCFGLCGNLTFCTRFLLQWLYSEIHKESRIPVMFWWQSIAGTLILLIYFLHQRDPVGILGYLMNVIPYSRNLILVYRKKRKQTEMAAAAPVISAQG